MAGTDIDARTGWVVLYEAGQVPSLETVRAAITKGATRGDGARLVSCRAITASDHGFPALECIVSGLSFDIVELGFGDDLVSGSARHGLSIEPSPHIAAASSHEAVREAGTALALTISHIGEPIEVGPIPSSPAAR